MPTQAMGVDIGGSHIACQLFDAVNGQMVPGSKVRMIVDGKGSKTSILKSWAEAICQTSGNRSLTALSGIGFAMPGPFDYHKGIARFDKNVDKFHCLNGVNIRTELRGMLDLPLTFPIRFLNDATCFALGALNSLPAGKYHRIIALTLGTGFGTAFIKNGLPIAGENGIPDDGFLYHVPFQQSIADDYFSTRWFLNEYRNQTGREISGVINLVELAETNSTAMRLFSDFGKNLGTFLIPWIQRFKAECIVLGGNISKSYSLFESSLNTEFKNNNIQLEIVISELDENAALIGSARLCDDEFYAKLIETGVY